MPEVVHTHKLSVEEDGAAEDIRPVIISINNVSMVFNMASEKLNSLKEYAIALARHNLFFEKFTALDDISFEIRKGDVFGILGTNGSGKSTLLKIIAGVLSPSEGTCTVEGNIAPLIELGAGFDMELSARENIFLNGALLGYPKAFIEQHFDEIVDFAEIEKFLDMPMKNYSSGMVARIAFAVATVMVPDILIVDEVLSVGDFVFQQKCEDRIDELISQHGVTVLIVSHSNDQIERLCNKAIWIEKGHVRMTGTASEVCNAYRVLGGRTGSKESEGIIFRALMEAEAHDEEEPFTTIKGDDQISTALRLAHAGWDSPEAVVLVPGHSHAFAVTMLGIAGFLDAPIIPYRYDDPLESIARILGELQPAHAYLIEPEDKIAALPLQERIPTGCTLHVRPSCDVLADIRTNVLEWGRELGCWKPGAPAYATLLADSSAAFSLSPYIYDAHAPFLVFGDGNGSVDARSMALLEELGTDTIVPVGSIGSTDLARQMEEAGFKVAAPFNNGERCNVSICQWVAAQQPFSADRAVIGSGIGPHWPDLIGAGSFAGKKQAPVLLEDPLDLDDVAACIGYLAEADPRAMTFVGARGLTDIDKRVLWAATFS